MSDNGRFLVYEDGSPFFYLGDTAWELLFRLKLEDALHFLEDRAEKGFTIVQVMTIPEVQGLTRPNAYGERVLLDGDSARPNEAFFRHLDDVVEKAAELGLFIGLLPTWGDKVGPKLWGSGPEVFTVENARVYGAWLGRRYWGAPLLWILGGAGGLGILKRANRTLKWDFVFWQEPNHHRGAYRARCGVQPLVQPRADAFGHRLPLALAEVARGCYPYFGTGLKNQGIIKTHSPVELRRGRWKPLTLKGSARCCGSASRLPL